MLDFTPVRNKSLSVTELAASLGRDDLRRLTNEMVDRMLELIAGCRDADVTFVPVDPQAHDSQAADPAERGRAWTLGHVVVHATASAEEAAFLAAELARGVGHHGRSRSEVPWQKVASLAQCRQRLEESRRMRLALLDVWPDEPHLDVLYRPVAAGGIQPEPSNCLARFVRGLMHDDAHLTQIAEIIRQARAA